MAGEPCFSACWRSVVEGASMAWALRAVSTAQHPGRVSCICRAATIAEDSQHGSIDVALAPAAMLGSLARGACKALFMEDRPAYGMCLEVPSGTKLRAGQMQWLLQQSGEYACTAYDGQLYGERLEQLSSRPRQRLAGARHLSTIMVTGGTHGLGLQSARNLSTSGCQSLVLTSRTAMLAPTDLAYLAEAGQFKTACRRRMISCL